MGDLAWISYKILQVIFTRDKSCNKDVLSDYCDGEAFQAHPLFSVRHGALEITLYYDDVEICNPLGSKRKIHKQGTC